MLISEFQEELIEQLEKKEVGRVTTTLEEYFELLPVYEGTEYNLLYDNGETILTMSIASAAHEAVTSNFIWALNDFFRKKDDDVGVFGSGRVIYVPDCRRSFVPDALVVFGEEEMFPRKGQIPALLNPKIIVEVQSESTKDVDFGQKLSCYKQISSVSEIIYASQLQPLVSVYKPTQNPKEWLVTDYMSLDESIKIQDFEIPMKEIYRKVVFGGKKKK